MKQYKVISVDGSDVKMGLQVGDIVTETKIKVDDVWVFRLPKRLYGRGHNGQSSNFEGYKNDNYKWLGIDQVEEIVK